MKAYEITLRIIDLDEIGGQEIKAALLHNRSACLQVAEIREADIGEWDDDHPLNRRETADAEWARLFPARDSQ